MRSASGRRQSKRLEERIAASQTVVFRGRGGLAYYEQATKFGADNVSSLNLLWIEHGLKKISQGPLSSGQDPYTQELVSNEAYRLFPHQTASGNTILHSSPCPRNIPGL